MDYKNAVNKGLVLQLRLNNMTNSFYAQTDDAARPGLEWRSTRQTKEIEKQQGRGCGGSEGH